MRRQQKETIVTIGANGDDIKVETKGYTGKECLDATADLEKALGKSVGRKKTPEYHQKATQQERQG